ncbi:MAG: hypothetical protein IK052_07320, partial [Bacteroidales bacterium]|nr:hypothetical protein [Bacteroidales bacterium]
EEVRIERLLGRGMTEEDARRRISAQSIDLSKANVIIENNGSLQALSRRVSRVFLSKNSYICKLENK